MRGCGNLRGIHARTGKRSGLSPSMYRSRPAKDERRRKIKKEKQDEQMRLENFKAQLETLKKKKLEEKAQAEVKRKTRREEVWSAEVNKREKLAFEASWMRAMAYVRGRRSTPSVFMSNMEMATEWARFDEGK